MEFLIFFLLPGLLFFLFFAYVIVLMLSAQEEARKAYEKHLEWLRASPTNAKLRQTTLQLGRKYAALTRTGNKVAIFDEVSIMNDIDAACAGAVNVQNPVSREKTTVVSPPVRSPEKRLKELLRLFATGHICEREYQKRRQCIIDGL